MKLKRLHNWQWAANGLAICLIGLVPLATGAAECVASSGRQRTAVLELYTSEGCSSCPPADQWVGQLPARKFTADRVIPLAFHVDYWNQLGWTDPFSQAQFSARQRGHSNRRGVSFVVTPQLLLNGQEYRAWGSFDDFANKLNPINQSKAQAAIRLKLERNGSLLVTSVDVGVGGEPAQKFAQVYLALYENNLVTPVGAGENKGRTLRHDFVVRKLVGPLALDDNGNLKRDQRFELDPRWKPHDVSLAVFVQQPQSGEVLQALAAHCE